MQSEKQVTQVYDLGQDGQGKSRLVFVTEFCSPSVAGQQGSFFRLGMRKFGLLQVSCAEDLFLQGL